MSRYVRPERRRARRQVDGPVGDEPPELEPVLIARVLRCPKCRYTLSTMRRWRLVCTECGHEWEEESNRTFVDKLSDTRALVGEYFIMAVMWCGLLAGLAILVGAPIVLAYLITGGGSFVGFALLLLFGLIVVFLVARFRWHHGDSALRRLRGWGQSEDRRP